MKTRQQIMDECNQRRRTLQKEFDYQLQLMEETHRERLDQIDQDQKEQLQHYC